MTYCDAIGESVEADFETAVSEIYPKLASASSREELWSHASKFGDALGIPGEFARYVSLNGSAAQHLLDLFSHNVQLLVEKTWVERNDEKRKEQLLDALILFTGQYERAEYLNALKTFNSLTSNLGYLLFGEQSQKDDFIDYSLRIDPKLALFWWLAREMKAERHDNPERVRALLLLAVYFLASF
jgi:hypothetical protein